MNPADLPEEVKLEACRQANDLCRTPYWTPQDVGKWNATGAKTLDALALSIHREQEQAREIARLKGWAIDADLGLKVLGAGADIRQAAIAITELQEQRRYAMTDLRDQISRMLGDTLDELHISQLRLATDAIIPIILANQAARDMKVAEAVRDACLSKVYDAADCDDIRTLDLAAALRSRGL